MASSRNISEFQIWIHPYLPGNLPVYTLLHELCHGQVGIGKRYGHKKTWRSLYVQSIVFYGRYMPLLEPTSPYLTNTWDTANVVVKRYSQSPKWLNEIDTILDTVADVESKVEEILYA